MARVTFTAGVGNIAGKVGEAVYATWKSGVSYVRKTTQNIRNPHSLAQSNARIALSDCAKDWMNNTTQAQRDIWNTYAQSKPGSHPNTGGYMELIKGNRGVMSGFNSYVLTNTILKGCAMTPVADAPIAAIPPSAPANVAATCLAGTVTVAWDEPLTHKADAVCRIFARVEGVPGHIQFVTTEDATTGTKDITAIRMADGKTVLLTKLVNKRIYVQMDTVDEDGTGSGASNTASCVIV